MFPPSPFPSASICVLDLTFQTTLIMNERRVKKSCCTSNQSSRHCLWWCILLQMEYERQVASVRAQNALEGDFSISQAEMSSRQAMLENASDIKVAHK